MWVVTWKCKESVEDIVLIAFVYIQGFDLLYLMLHNLLCCVHGWGYTILRGVCAPIQTLSINVSPCAFGASLQDMRYYEE